MEAKTSYKQYINDLKPEIAKRLNEAYWYIRKNTEYVNQGVTSQQPLMEMKNMLLKDLLEEL